MPSNCITNSTKVISIATGKNYLVELIIASEWVTARELIRTHPNLAKKWSSSQGFSGDMLYSTDILPLHQACTKVDVQIDFLELLILAYPKSLLKCETANNRNLLHISVRCHLCDEIIAYLVDKNPDTLLSQDSHGRIPLHYACSNLASLATIKKLITTHPGTVSATDKVGWTPLHVASSQSPSLVIIETLLGFCPEAIVMLTANGISPMRCAEINNKSENKAVIISHLANNEQRFHQLPIFENMRNAERRNKKPLPVLVAPNEKLVGSYASKKMIKLPTSHMHFV